MNINLKSIGTINSPFCQLENMPVQPKGAREVFATIKIKKKYRKGLNDLDGFNFVYLIYYFHKIKKYQLQVIPFMDKVKQKRGVFSTRTPLHPNSIGLSVVELVKIEKENLIIKGIDILDGTPLLDIKPYIDNFDKIDKKPTSGWMMATQKDVINKKSDDRFIQ